MLGDDELFIIELIQDGFFDIFSRPHAHNKCRGEKKERHHRNQYENALALDGKVRLQHAKF